MVTGVQNFIGSRLTQARKARGLAAISLAELVGVSQSTISLYEKDKQKPKHETIGLLSRILNLPMSFFFSEIKGINSNKLFYRSMSSATKLMRDRVEARHEWVLDVLDYLKTYFDFPEKNFPNFEIPDNFIDIEDSLIEKLANSLREFWNLGDRPIGDMTQLLESNGVIVYRGKMGSDKLDAFSDPNSSSPIIALSNDKENYFRSRFDAAHELGHLVLHGKIEKNNLNKTQDFKIIENQAHYFASVFLLPETSYSKDLWTPSLEAFRSLKPIWNTSIAMQIVRARNLGFISPEEEKRLWINRTRRGWSKVEPMDSSTPAEQPNLIYKSFKILIDEGVKTKEQIISDLNISAIDLSSLFGLPDNLLGDSGISSSPRLKLATGSNVVGFKR